MAKNERLESKLFESRQVSQLTGAPARSLKYWAASGVLTPEKDAVGRPGIRRAYSFVNLVEVAVLNELYRQKVTMPLAREAIARLREAEFDTRLICFLLITSGKIEVFTEDNLSSEEDRMLLKQFEKALPLDIPNYLERMRRESEITKLIGRLLWAQLGERILSKEEGFLVIPVHALWDRISDKVRNL